MAYSMHRKLIRLGKSTLVVTLPRIWVNQMKLKAGDKVEMVINKKLIIRMIK